MLPWFYFCIDNKMVVLGNTHVVQLGGFHNMAASFLQPWCFCLMNIREVSSSLRTCFHLNINQVHPYLNSPQTFTQLCVIIMPLPYNL